MSSIFRAGLDQLATRIGTGAAHGRGLLLALDLPHDLPAAHIADTLINRAKQRDAYGVLVNAVRTHRLRFMPALNVSASDIDDALSRLSEAMETGRALN